MVCFVLTSRDTVGISEAKSTLNHICVNTTLTQTSMIRKFSTIEISDVVDHNGAARYGFEDVGAPVNDNATIAPWIDEPVGIDYLAPLPSSLSDLDIILYS